MASGCAVLRILRIEWTQWTLCRTHPKDRSSTSDGVKRCLDLPLAVRSFQWLCVLRPLWRLLLSLFFSLPPPCIHEDCLAVGISLPSHWPVNAAADVALGVKCVW